MHNPTFFLRSNLINVLNFISNHICSSCSELSYIYIYICKDRQTDSRGCWYSNYYYRRKWLERGESQIRTKQLSFHIALIPLERI